MTSQVSNPKYSESRWRWLYIVGGVAALIVIGLFLIGTIGFVAQGLFSITDGWFVLLENNWLVVLLKMNLGLSVSGLSVLSIADIVIMVLFCLNFLALYFALRRTSRILSLIALSLPFLGVPIFILTSTAGRSALLVGGLLFSIVMLRSKVFSKVTAYVGITASALLFFAGDIATAIFSFSNVIAFFIGAGYILWMAWFFQIARRLLQLGAKSVEE